MKKNNTLVIPRLVGCFIGFVLFGGGTLNSLVAQTVGYDNIWVGGLNEYPGTPGSGNYIIRWSTGSPVVEEVDLGMNFESTTAAMCDSMGNLLYYSNGCTVRRSLNAWPPEVSFSFDEPNPGEIKDWVCPSNGYIGPKGVCLLPDIYQPWLRTAMFTMGVDYDPWQGYRYGPLSTHCLNNLSSNSLNSSSPLQSPPNKFEPMSLVRNGNGRDWWLIVPRFWRDEYFVFPVGLCGTLGTPVFQELGDLLKCKRHGSTTFSPDGRKFARTLNCGTIVMDFDRCTGKLSNPITLPRPGHAMSGGGVAFSKDGNRVVITESLAILSADLTVPNPQFDTLIAWDQTAGMALEQMQYAPDGKIYISSVNRSKHFASLELLDDGTAIFDKQAITLPVWNVRSIPNVPNYRLYDLSGGPCDTLGINAPVSVQTPVSPPVRVVVSPNPTTNEATFEWSNGPVPVASLTLFNGQGQPVYQHEFGQNNSTNTIRISLAGKPAGGYYWQLALENGVLHCGRLVKM